MSNTEHTGSSPFAQAAGEAPQVRELALKNSIAEVFLTASGKAIYQQVLALLLDFFQSRYGIFGYIARSGEYVCPSITKDVWDECGLMEEDSATGALIFHPSAWGGLWGRGLQEKCACVANEGPFSLPKGHVQFQSVIIMPIVYKETLIGQIVLADKPEGYTEQDQQILEKTCNYVAPLLNSRLESEWARGDLEAAKAQAEHASQAKTQFLANISHELRTPLHGVLGCLQLLDTDNLDPGDAELVQMAQQSGSTLLQLINDILDLTDSGDPGEKVQEHALSVAEEFDMLTQVFSYQLREKGLALQTHVDAAVPQWVVGNVHRLRQVLLKLVDNAIKFSPQGEIRVSATVVGQNTDERSDLAPSPQRVSLLVSVSDEGIGLDDDALERIFKLFTQGEMSLSRTYSGTGLGLSMVKKSVDAMRGHIAIDNSGPGIVVHVQVPFTLPE